MLRNQDLNLLPIFDALVQERQLSRAAERLSMSQPAVSKALKRLRLSFKDELFVRTRRGLKPTPRALRLHNTLAPALNVIRQSYDAYPFSPEQVDRAFDVTMNSTVELVAMPIIAAHLHRVAPRAVVRVHPDYLPDIPTRLKDGRLDCAVEFVDLPDDQFDSRFMVEETLVTICAPDHPKAGQRLSIDEFQALPHVSVMPRASLMPSQNNRQLTPIEFLLGSRLPKRNVVMQASSFVAVPGIVAASGMIAIISNRQAAPFIRAGKLATLELPFESPTLKLSLYWHKSRNSDPGHRWFVEMISKLSAEL